jgi:hypothetical protein
LYEKRYLRRYNNSAKFGDETLQFMRRDIDQINPQNWKNYIRHVIKIEETYRQDFVQELIIELGNDATSESSEDNTGRN